MNQVKPGHCAARQVIWSASSGVEPAVGASHGPFWAVCRKIRMFWISAGQYRASPRQACQKSGQAWAASTSSRNRGPRRQSA